eukprot:GHVU01128471.1.p1 GENE.GHVU01128471.1~~GHVU01128471.1.p1  ORF type:complete len:158 (+),score=13.45 GHVU01128471.1:636-1109(+)
MVHEEGGEPAGGQKRRTKHLEETPTAQGIAKCRLLVTVAPFSSVSSFLYLPSFSSCFCYSFSSVISSSSSPSSISFSSFSLPSVSSYLSSAASDCAAAGHRRHSGFRPPRREVMTVVRSGVSCCFVRMPSSVYVMSHVRVSVRTRRACWCVLMVTTW